MAPVPARGCPKEQGGAESVPRDPEIVPDAAHPEEGLRGAFGELPLTPIPTAARALSIGASDCGLRPLQRRGRTHAVERTSPNAATQPA